MRIHNIYADERGESHFRDSKVEWAEEGPDGTTSKRLPAAGIIFRFTRSDWRFDWHTAPRRQCVVNLDGPNQITASDGETRIMHGRGDPDRGRARQGAPVPSGRGQVPHSILIPVDYGASANRRGRTSAVTAPSRAE